MTVPLRLVFFGSDPIARPLLDWLAGEGRAIAEVAAVFTQPDRPAGRGRKVRPNAIKSWAAAQKLPVWQPEKLTEEVRLGLAALGADAGLVLAYGHILSDAFIATPRLGLLNLHASLLPRHRGASPIEAAITAGDAETGMSLMRIVRELDAGPVADVERVAIGPLDTAAEVTARLAAACPPLLARSLPRLARGALSFAPQDPALATFCRRLRKEDGVLDFGAPASVLAARVNGLHPWPGCAVEIAGHAIRLGRADAVDAEAGAPAGTVLGGAAEGVPVATGRGILRLRELQRPGGRLLPAAEFIRGFPLTAGTKLPSQPMPEFCRAGRG